MGEHQTKWMKKMVERYGSEEAVSLEMKRRQKKSRETYSGKGGFAHMKQHDPERLTKLSAQGGKTSARTSKPRDNS